MAWRKNGGTRDARVHDAASLCAPRFSVLLALAEGPSGPPPIGRWPTALPVSSACPGDVPFLLLHERHPVETRAVEVCGPDVLNRIANYGCDERDLGRVR
jgi:hypothetical protein